MHSDGDTAPLRSAVSPPVMLSWAETVNTGGETLTMKKNIPALLIGGAMLTGILVHAFG